MAFFDISEDSSKELIIEFYLANPKLVPKCQG